jgi:glutathione S-transferase
MLPTFPDALDCGGTIRNIAGVRRNLMKLLWSSRSPFVRKVVVTAHELGITERIELQRVNVTASATNAEVMQLNPLNKIPTLLLDDGSVMIDSPVIAEYLDETYGKGEPFARNTPRRWQVRRLHALGDGIMNFNIARLGEKARGENASEAFAATFLAKTKATLDGLEQETEQLDQLSASPSRWHWRISTSASPMTPGAIKGRSSRPGTRALRHAGRCGRPRRRMCIEGGGQSCAPSGIGTVSVRQRSGPAWPRGLAIGAEKLCAALKAAGCYCDVWRN